MLVKIDRLVFDDWSRSATTLASRRDLMEIRERPGATCRPATGMSAGRPPPSLTSRPQHRRCEPARQSRAKRQAAMGMSGRCSFIGEQHSRDRIVRDPYRLTLDGPSTPKTKARGGRNVRSCDRREANEGGSKMTAPVPRPARPRGSTGTCRARRCVWLKPTARRARRPAVG
jgi:hypothetical protein